MTVTFSIRGVDYDVEDGRAYVNMSNFNARDIFERMGIPLEDLCGEMRAKRFGPLCRKALTVPDEGLKEVYQDRYHFLGRRPGRIKRALNDLLGLCEQAGDLGVICWS